MSEIRFQRPTSWSSTSERSGAASVGTLLAGRGCVVVGTAGRIQVIVAWQGITVTLFSLPMAALNWQAPSPLQWFIFLLCGMMGSAAHYCITRSYKIADISATQSVKFLDLVWAALIGWLMFSDSPSQSTLIGGTVICASTIWIAHREAKRGPRR